MANRYRYPHQQHLGEKTNHPLHKYVLVGDRVEEIHSVIVKTILMGDVEDPDLFVADPILRWQETEAGKFVMEHSVETPMWHRVMDPITYGHKYMIQAWLMGKDYTFWQLKFANTVDK